MSRTIIIAEAGVNHNGDLNLAHQLVEAAVAAGADLVKFQTFAADRLVTRHAATADYQRASGQNFETQHAMLQRLELDRDAHAMLLAHCSDRGIGFISSPFDEAGIDLLVELGVAQLKIPSGELTNLPYLRHVACQDRPIILSTGMATLGEIEAALDVLEQGGTPRNRVTVLHCNTEYPTPMADVNLRAMVTLRTALGVAVGYSDHTLGIEVPIAAVALGAAVIEKHFTLDQRLRGPDHRSSLEPLAFKEMVTAIRNIEQALGDGIKRPSASESRNKPIVRKSLVAARAIQKGELFTEQNVAVKRPGTGISPMRWDEVMGRRAPRDFSSEEPLEL